VNYWGVQESGQTTWCGKHSSSSGSKNVLTNDHSMSPMEGKVVAVILLVPLFTISL
jgi:hypothetical protein